MPTARRPFAAQVTRFAALGALTVALAGCQIFERISRIGDVPELSPIENPVEAPGYKPVSMPMPAPLIADRQANSLWRPGARAFFRDNRAATVGDLITKVVRFDGENPNLSNETSRARDQDDELDAPTILGWEKTLADLIANQGANFTTPGGDADGDWLSLGRAMTLENSGSISRSETVDFRLAAVITQTLPNGNLVLFGRQELRV
ncbi:MAG: flagellar basal body L-ring protein FlgH, partial [Pseudomonadota bacterium]